MLASKASSSARRDTVSDVALPPEDRPAPVTGGSGGGGLPAITLQNERANAANGYTDTLPAIANANPYLDPTYLAYLRELGANEADARAEAGSVITRLRGRITDMQPIYADRMRLGLEGISENFEGRGLLRSGRRLTEQNQFQTDLTREKAAAEQSINDQIGATSADLARTVARGRRARAEAELDARDRVARENAALGM